MPNTPVRAAAEGMPEDEPKTLLDAMDILNRADWLFEAALMASEAIDEKRHSEAIETLLTIALDTMREGLAIVEDVRTGERS